MSEPIRIHVWRRGDKPEPQRVSDIEDAAIRSVAASVAATPRQAHMAKALIRLAGNALAKIGGHEEAFRHHAERAKHHYERMGKTRR